MMFAERPKVIVDLGGGDGSLVLREAVSNRDDRYFLVDPSANGGEFPDNVQIISDLVGAEKGLPFEDGGVGEVWMHYLMGEIISNDGWGDGSVEDAMRLYGILAGEVARILNPSGKVWVMDVKSNIEYARRVFLSHGFEISYPQRVRDEQITTWTQIFFNFLNLSMRSEEESEVLPMEFVATKIIR